MKKIIIITGMMLLAVSAFAQQSSRTSERQKGQDHKSETTARRSVQSNTRNNHLQANKSSSESDRSTAATTVRKVNTPINSKPDRNNYSNPVRKPVKVAHKPAHYRTPDHAHVIWTHQMYGDYRLMYPEFRYRNYHNGYRIVTVPSYNAYFHVGEVRNVYGRIHEVWYSWSTDEYYMYFGGTYPYQDFTVILPGNDARRFNRHPEAYFSGRYIWVTGPVSTFEGKPEIMVKRNSQIHLY